MQGKPFMAKIGGITLASISWRVLFVINLVINTALTGNINGQLASSSTLISFILYSGLVDAAILTAFTGIRELVSQKVEWKFSPSLLLSLSTFVCAVVVTIVF
jgi:hypothetical protein